MPRTILICTDGSPRAEAALRSGFDVLAAADRVVIASIVEPLDPGLVVGTGMAGGVMTPSEALVMQSGVQDHGQDAVGRLRTDLGIPDAELQVLTGSPGTAICDLATELGASAIVIGSRGRSGFRRAVLGSVSDHVVRHAPCPVVVTTIHDEDV
jgi:nucleotide-binding universal stress UspA family protein